MESNESLMLDERGILRNSQLWLTDAMMDGTVAYVPGELWVFDGEMLRKVKPGSMVVKDGEHIRVEEVMRNDG